MLFHVYCIHSSLFLLLKFCFLNWCETVLKLNVFCFFFLVNNTLPMKLYYFWCWSQSCSFTTWCLKNLAQEAVGFVTSEIYISFHVIYRGSGKSIQPLQKSFSVFFHLEPPQQRYFSLFYTIVLYKAFTFSISLMSWHEEKISFQSGKL